MTTLYDGHKTATGSGLFVVVMAVQFCSALVGSSANALALSLKRVMHHPFRLLHEWSVLHFNRSIFLK